MILTPEIETFIGEVRKSIASDTFVKLTLSKMAGGEEGLINVYIRKIELKGENQLSFTLHYQTRDEVKNHPIEEGLGIIRLWLGVTILNANLLTSEADYNLVFNKKRKARLLTKKASLKTVPSTTHDRSKARQITPEGNVYLRALGITSAEGKVMKEGQRKFKQINKYIEILSGLIKDNFEKEQLNILDVGSGKGYLTFALYDFLKNSLHKKPQIAGIELRQPLVDFTNQLAAETGFDQLQFIAKDINDFEVKDLDILIALHACDIATDIAIAKGIQSNAKLIVVAPCCHKQIRKEMNCSSELAPILKHGILEERQAELITDGIRALLLEAHGYKTKVFEFISTEHTSKNLMIVGTKAKADTGAYKKIEDIKKSFGIEEHYLEGLLER
ncbi:MAG: SAM-dependent methyltransferase [Saprospiraceae bacterium]|jgi:SAM-dependent methyltransferase